MNLFSKKEKVLVKSLIYGFIGGLYYSILFTSRTREIVNQGNFRTYQELTVFEYVVKVLQTSIIFSVGTVIVVLLYLYYRNIKKR